MVKGAVWLLLYPVSCIPIWAWTQYKPLEEVVDMYSRELRLEHDAKSRAVSRTAQVVPLHGHTAIPMEVPQPPDRSKINIYVHVQPSSTTVVSTLDDTG